MAVCEPSILYSAEQSRRVDRCAIEEHGASGPGLMARAARAAFRVLLERWPKPARVQIVCGPGNNGGDGLLLGALAAGRGIPTEIWLVDGEPRSADAQLAASRARAAGLSPAAFASDVLSEDAVIVDALLGTGFRDRPREHYALAIDAINACPAPVLSLDVPSGLNADSGAALGAVVQATATISFITAKRGLFTAEGPDRAGIRILDTLDVPDAAYAAAGAGVAVLDLAAERAGLVAPTLASHKGHFGRCLLVAGDRGTGGAALLAAEAALRSGVGLLRVATREEHIAPLLARTPEAMALAVRGRPDLAPHLDWADAVILGPGLGTGPWGEQLLAAVLDSGKPALLDADALNLLARDPHWVLAPNSIMTPHPGEAGRLLASSGTAVQADRFLASERLADRASGAIILKGNGSIVRSGPDTALCVDGNPGMASGGTGDVLSGIVGGLLAQGLPPSQAARLGCVLHAVAADTAARRVGMRGLIASDIAPELGRLLS